MGSDVQVVSGTLESIENAGFFNAFSFFIPKENPKSEDSFSRYLLSAVLLIGNRTINCTFRAVANSKRCLPRDEAVRAVGEASGAVVIREWLVFRYSLRSLMRRTT